MSWDMLTYAKENMALRAEVKALREALRVAIAELKDHHSERSYSEAIAIGEKLLGKEQT